VDWFKDFEKWLSGGFIGAFVYGLLRWREQLSADRRGEVADDLSERRQEVDGFKELADRLDKQWKDCLQRCNEQEHEIQELYKRMGELEHENRQLQTRLLGYTWMESGSLSPQALRRLADEMEARERADGV
jgi:chromosome segregation ATPase